MVFSVYFSFKRDRTLSAEVESRESIIKADREYKEKLEAEVAILRRTINTLERELGRAEGELGKQHGI